MIKICIAGATGWAGSALSKGVLASQDLQLVSAVSRSQAGNDLHQKLGTEGDSIPVFATAAEALAVPSDIFVEYTKPHVAKANVLAALHHNRNVVVGTSGLSDEDYQEIEEKALQQNRGVLAVGNFALTVVLLQKFAEISAKYIPNWEIIDYAHQHKKDVPSGTVRELAHRLGQVRASHIPIPIEDMNGPKATRGADLNGTQVHSVRLPGHVIGVETIFGLPDEKLTIRHDAGTSAEPYVGGALLAIRKVSTFVGLRRGLDSVMEF